MPRATRHGAAPPAPTSSNLSAKPAMTPAEPTSHPPAGGDLVYRHRVSTRVWHWINAATMLVMLMSGLMIFNAHPRLYWGQYGANPDPAWLEIERGDDGGYLADAEASSRFLLDPTEALGDALPDRLERLVAGAVEGGVDADAFRRAVVDGDEHGDLAVLDGEGGGHVGSPHGVDGLRNDRAVMVARATGAADAGRRRQAVLPHQAAHPLLRGAQARMAQPRPDLPVALAVERAVDEHLPDRLDQRGVGHRPLRPRPAPWRGRRFRCAAAAIDPRPRDAPDAADPGDTVAAARGDRDDGAHRFDLRAAKGMPPPASSRSIFA